MLAINIPKLSGQCGKLVCCLKFEDDTYTDLKKLYPSIGDVISYNKIDFKVVSFNVINKQITLENAESDMINLSLDEYNKIKFNKENKKQNRK